MAEYDFHFTAEVMDGIFGEVITARGAWDTLGERLDNMEQGTGDTYTKAEVDTMLAEKVNTEEGKGLSSNDFTDSDKAQISANKAGIGAVANRGSKNQLDVSQTSSTMNAGNITITKGADGSLTLNGTSTAVSDVLIGRITLPAGDYVLSGCAEGGSGGTWLIRIFGNQVVSNSSHTVGTVFHTEGITNADVRIVVGNNKTLTDAVFKPMLCTKAEWDISQEFVLYAPTNRELWEKINSIKRTYKVPISSTPVNNIYFGVQMFPFEFDSVPNATIEVQNIGQGGVSIDPSKFTTQIATWGFRIYTTDSSYAGLIPDVVIS